MKKYIISFSLVFALVLYIVLKQAGNSASALPPQSVASGDPSVSSSSSAPVPSRNASPQKQTGLYKDGRYTGVVADAYYGNVQVAVTIRSGKVADVQFLDYPHDRGTSIEINTQAMPYLKTEAIQAQSANVATVSGATQTSGAFMRSLSSALQQATG